LLANPLKVKLRAEDVKNDKVDSKTLAHLTRIGWLPIYYVPPAELRLLRSMLRHRAFRSRHSTGVKNRTKSEFRKRDIAVELDLKTRKGRKEAFALYVFELTRMLSSWSL
jgi:transposase